MIKDILGLNNDVAVIMGANIAGEVARDQFVETTVGMLEYSDIVNNQLGYRCLGLVITLLQLFNYHCFTDSLFPTPTPTPITITMRTL